MELIKIAKETLSGGNERALSWWIVPLIMGDGMGAYQGMKETLPYRGRESIRNIFLVSEIKIFLSENGQDIFNGNYTGNTLLYCPYKKQNIFIFIKSRILFSHFLL